MSPRIAGVDEAGRGPLAGPVVAAAVILDRRRPILGLADSKKLSPKRRAELAAQIRARALSLGIGMADVVEIDQFNILRATLLAMRRAVERLDPAPGRVLVDGNSAPLLDLPTETIVRGDASEPAISAASILAKTVRDEWMRRLDLRYPGYGFASHKGYPVPAHIEALKRLGPCPEHRQSFRPVAILQPMRKPASIASPSGRSSTSS